MTLKEGFENFKSRYLSREEKWSEEVFMEVVQNAILNVLDRFVVDISIE